MGEQKYSYFTGFIVFKEDVEMEAIIKTIIFAVCFPLGMSLIYGLRRKIKGAKIVSDSNLDVYKRQL